MVYLNLTRMSIKASQESSEVYNTIHFVELEIANVLKRVVVIVRYPRDEM